MDRAHLAFVAAALLLLAVGCGSASAKKTADSADAVDAVAAPDALPDAAKDVAPAADLAQADTAVAPADVVDVADAATPDAAPAVDVEAPDAADVPLLDVTDAAIADAGPPEAWSCPSIDADKYPSDAGDTTPGYCFVGPPAADAFVMDVPSPKDCPCPPDPPTAFFGTEPIPPAKLVVELGVGDDTTGAFKPYADGDWVPITHGPQGGVHVWAAFRVALAGAKDPKVKMQTRATSFVACALAGTGNTAIVYATPDAALPGSYTNASAAMPGIQVVFPIWGNESSAYCGQWLELRMQVRDSVSGAWGEVRRTVRLYDTEMMLGG